MKIIIEEILHEKQRYETAGDYWIDADGVWQIRVSHMSDSRHVLLVAVHELVEMALFAIKYRRRNPREAIRGIDDFDIGWKPHANVLEPGDDFRAPYYYEHQLATSVERMLAAEMCVDWAEYDRIVNALGEPA